MWHCRHGDTGKPVGVVVAIYAGMTPAGKVAEGNTVTDWDEEEIARKITIHTGSLCRMGPGGQRAAGQGEKIKINFWIPWLQQFINDTPRVAGGGGRRADRGGRACGVQVVRKSVDYATEYDLRARSRSTGWTASWRLTSAR